VIRPAVAALAAALALAACGGGTPRAEPTPLEPTTATPKPTPKPRPTPTRTATPTPTPSPTPVVPSPAGDVATTAGATLALAADPGQPRKVAGGADCASVFTDLARVRCAAVRLDGGDLLWAVGAEPGNTIATRLYVLGRDGYLLRYEARDTERRWTNVFVRPGTLTGHGTDGVAVVFRLTGTPGETAYDVLTWVKGGPLVLRAHRPALADGRVAVRPGWIDDYAIRGNGTYARRRVVWDGRHFRVSPEVLVPSSKVPPY
jgi:hypothetical protein